MTSHSVFFKYLTPSSDDLDWGLYLNVAGFAHIAPNDSYPPTGHPSGYSFNWNNGRVLHEFQILYITDGSGILETKTGRWQIHSGSVLFIFPGMWHRYRPNIKTGWKEYYIGFHGNFTQSIFSEKFISRQKPILYIGFQDLVVKQFNEIIENIKEEKPGYQQVCSGITLHLLGNILSINRNKDFSGKEIEKKIRRACIYMRDNLHSEIHIEELANELNIGYSHFRRVFKKYTGLSPAQYHLTLRLQKSKELLITTNLSIKQVAFEMGFQSNFYFTRIFTRKMGVNPSSVRKNSLD